MNRSHETSSHCEIQTHLLIFAPRFYPAFANKKNNISAGVLVALYDDQDWTCILTQRSTGLKKITAVKIVFSGGKQQKKIVRCKIQRSEKQKEEVGLEAKIIGQLSSIPLYTSEFELQDLL